MDGLAGQVRVLAGRVARSGEEVRAAGTRLAGLAGLDWQGAAAAEFTVQLGQLRAVAARAATACDAAATALTTHAGRVAEAEQRLDVLAPVPGPLA